MAAGSDAAEKRRIELVVLEIRSPEEVSHAVEVGVKDGSRALVQLSSPIFDGRFAARTTDLTSKYRLPAISMFRRFADAGGLMSNGPNQLEITKRSAAYIDKILKGAKAAELPIEEPKTYDLVIDLKTARALGLAIPHSLLQRADGVIQ